MMVRKPLPHLLVVVFAVIILGAPDAGGHGALYKDLQRINEKLAEESEPSTVQLLLTERSDLYRRMGHFSLARADAEAALDADAKNQEARRMLALAAHEEGDLHGALFHSAVFLRESPHSKSIRRMRVKALGALKRRADLVRELERALATTPDPDFALDLASAHEASGHLAAAEEVLEKSLRIHPGHRALSMKRIEMALLKGDFVRAEKLSRAHLRPHKVAGREHLLLARALIGQGKRQEAHGVLDDALQSLTRAIGRRDSATRRLNRARVQRAMDRPKEARADLAWALSRWPHVDALHTQARDWNLESELALCALESRS
jgi:tetratricopeptide (TPR) repeat protein